MVTPEKITVWQKALENRNNHTWLAFCHEFITSSEADVAKLKPVIEPVLEKWPDQTRFCPTEGFLRLMEGNVTPFLVFARSIRSKHLAKRIRGKISNALPRLLEKPELSVVRMLSLYGNHGITPFFLKTLFNSKNIGRIQTLEITHSAVGDWVIKELSDTKSISVRYLNLWRTNLTASSLLKMADSQQFVYLTGLNLGGNGIGDGIGSLGTICQLNLLNLDQCFLRSKAMKNFLKWPLSNLEILSLSGNYLDVEAIGMIFDSAILPALKFVDLNYNLITDECMQLIAASPKLQQMDVVKVYSYTVSQNGWDTLFHSPYITESARQHLKKHI